MGEGEQQVPKGLCTDPPEELEAEMPAYWRVPAMLNFGCIYEQWFHGWAPVAAPVGHKFLQWRQPEAVEVGNVIGEDSPDAPVAARPIRRVEIEDGVLALYRGGCRP